MKREDRIAAPKNLSPGQIINRLRKAEVALANGKTTMTCPQERYHLAWVVRNALDWYLAKEKA